MSESLSKRDPMFDIKERLYDRLADQKELLERSKKNLSAYDSYQSGQWDAQENCWADEIEFLMGLLGDIENAS